MSFLRTSALRASVLTRATRPTSCFRAVERVPWQRTLQRRTYASAHGEAQSSEVPWMAAGVAMTVGGLFFVVNQDLGHGPGHDEDHHAESHETHGKNKGQEEPDTDDSKTGDGAEKAADTADDKKDIAKDDAESKKKEESKGKKNDESGAPSPDKSDKPAPRGESKSSNEMSGKQEGLSNTDTKHSTAVSESEDKSKKGEGVADTAKLKGTVSTDRPAAENKEERGKAQSDKN